MLHSNSNEILISVVTPTFNRIELLKENLESVKNQIIDPAKFGWEHVVVNDCSSDDTDAFMHEYARLNPHCRYIKNPQNLGNQVSLNTGIEASKGQWIFCLDDDDTMFQRGLHNFYNLIKNQTGEKVFYVFDFIRSGVNLEYMIGQDYYGWNFANTDEWFRAVANGQHFIQNNTLFPKQLAMSVGGNDTSLEEGYDIELYIRFVKAGYTPTYSPLMSHIHRFHSSNRSQTIEQIVTGFGKDYLKVILEKHPELKTYLTK